VLGSGFPVWLGARDGRAHRQAAPTQPAGPLQPHGRTRFAGGAAEAWSTTGVADESL